METHAAMLQEHFQPDRLVHAYGLEGDTDVLVAALPVALESALGVSMRGNPDVVSLSFDRLMIDEARAIIDRATNRAASGENSFFLIRFSRATNDAQNALLKLLEEPRDGRHFFLIVPSIDVLLPTLRSRLYCIDCRAMQTDAVDKAASTFLAAAASERLESVAGLIEEKDRESARRFLESLERELYRHKNLERAQALRAVSFARDYMGDPSSSVKMLLEYVAAAVPHAV